MFSGNRVRTFFENKSEIGSHWSKQDTCHVAVWWAHASQFCLYPLPPWFSVARTRGRGIGRGDQVSARVRERPVEVEYDCFHRHSFAECVAGGNLL